MQNDPPSPSNSLQEPAPTIFKDVASSSAPIDPQTVSSSSDHNSTASPTVAGSYIPHPLAPQQVSSSIAYYPSSCSPGSVHLLFSQPSPALPQCAPGQGCSTECAEVEPGDRICSPEFGLKVKQIYKYCSYNYNQVIKLYKAIALFCHE